MSIISELVSITGPILRAHCRYCGAIISKYDWAEWDDDDIDCFGVHRNTSWTEPGYPGWLACRGWRSRSYRRYHQPKWSRSERKALVKEMFDIVSHVAGQ